MNGDIAVRLKAVVTVLGDRGLLPSGKAAAIAARAAARRGDVKGTVLGGVGAVVGGMTDIEAAVSAPVAGRLPIGLPALTILAPVIGLPHAHMHPPNLIPPNPVPVPIPSIGAVIPIPYLSGASSTTIIGLKAARCGDLGVGHWCGGYFPLFEIFLGSANVWIEGARAARVGIDVTKHCIFTSPQPTDRPLGPFFGTSVVGVASVLIGGFPLPSLTAMVLGAAFKMAFRLLGKVLGKLARITGLKGLFDKLVKKYAAKFVEDLLAKNPQIRLHGDAAFNDAARKDLAKMAETWEGRKALTELAEKGKAVNIVDMLHADAQGYVKPGPCCVPHVEGDAYHQVRENPAGVADRWGGGRADPVGSNKGCGSNVLYDPLNRTGRGMTTPKSPSDVVLAHELGHASNYAKGDAATHLKTPGDSKFPNWEENNVVNRENKYREQRGGVPLRPSYEVP